MHRPFILGIGSQRAGSTLLANVLGRHPEIRMNPVKELHYFDTRFNLRGQGALTQFSLRQLQREAQKLVSGPDRKLLEKGWRWYFYTNFLLFSKPVSELAYSDLFPEEFAVGRYIGESTPEYMLLDDTALESVRETIGDAKVIISCRNPVQRLLSSFKLLIHYNQLHLDQCQLNSHLLQLLDCNSHWYQTQLRFGDYVPAIAKFRRHFSNVLPVFYDDFRENARGLLASLSEFLALEFSHPQFIAAFETRINELPMRFEPSLEIQDLLAERLGAQCTALDDFAGRPLLM